MFDEYGPVDDDGSLDDGSLDDGSLVDELFDHLTRHFTHSEVEDEQGHFDHFTHDELTYDEVDAVDPGLLSYLRVHPEVFEGSPPVIDLPYPFRLQKVE